MEVSEGGGPGGDNKHSEQVEARGRSGEEADEEAKGGGWSRRRSDPEGTDEGGLDLGGEEGRERDLGDQCGAGVVDERIDLLSLLTAGFDLENTETNL